MARSRLELHELITSAVGSNVPVYFQPPSNIRMSYPCVMYERARSESKFADDKPYATFKRYSIKVFDRDPDSSIPDAIAKLPMCVHTSFFVFDNLNQDSFDIFF